MIHPRPPGLALIYDTETTGKWLPKLPLLDDAQPRLVQLAAVLVTETWREVACLVAIVRPEDFVISAEVAAIHRIPHEFACQVGIPLESILGTFQSMVNRASCLVAHNIAYDRKVLLRELTPMGLGAVFAGKVEICTMQDSTDVCRLPSKWGRQFKWPRLGEVYRIAFGEEHVAAHDALNDLRATVRVWRWLLEGAPLPAESPPQPYDEDRHGEGVSGETPQHAQAACSAGTHGG